LVLASGSARASAGESVSGPVASALEPDAAVVAQGAEVSNLPALGLVWELALDGVLDPVAVLVSGSVLAEARGSASALAWAPVWALVLVLAGELASVADAASGSGSAEDGEKSWNDLQRSLNDCLA
jgi:hypothetical protein